MFIKIEVKIELPIVGILSLLFEMSKAVMVHPVDCLAS